MSTESSVDPGLFANLVPLNALKRESQSDLAKKSSIATAKTGEYLFKVGDTAKSAIFVLSGEVGLEDASGKVLNRINGGDSHSLHRLAHQSPRKASAKCLSAVRYLSVDSSLLDVMLTWDQTGTFEVGDLTGAQDADSGDWMTKLLQMRTFQLVPPANLQSMFMKMRELKVEPGKVIVKQGDEGDFFYIIIEGRCLVTREQPNQKPIRLAELEAGACFGEEALISDTKRNASITMMTSGKLMQLSKTDFRNLLNDPLARKMSYAQGEQLVKDGKAKWLDVRLPTEFQSHNIPGSINLPLYMLRMKLATLDNKLTYLVCCDTGRRSSVAVFVLTQKGFDAYMLDKGIPPKP